MQGFVTAFMVMQRLRRPQGKNCPTLASQTGFMCRKGMGSLCKIAKTCTSGIEKIPKNPKALSKQGYL
jgi:hypothetical protein